MQLTDVFTPDVVLVPLRASNDDDALRQLVMRLVATTHLGGPEAVLARLAEESSLRATLVGHGAGIVHSRLEDLQHPVAALGVMRGGDSLHLGESLQFVVDVIFLVLSPLEPPEPHLELVSEIATLVRDQVAMNGLREALNPTAAVECLAGYSASHA